MPVLSSGLRARRAAATGASIAFTGGVPLGKTDPPERWRRTPKFGLAVRNDVNYTCTKDAVHLVWRVSRMGDFPQDGDSEIRRRAVMEYGFNSPFEEIALALRLRKNGLWCSAPRAVYMTGSLRSGARIVSRMPTGYRKNYLTGTMYGLPLLR